MENGHGVSAHFHSNISPSGKVFTPLCDINGLHWDASWTIPEVLLSLLVMLHRNNNRNPACEDPYRAWRNLDGATNYHLNRRDYRSMQRQWAVGTRSNWQRIGIDAAAKAPPPQAVIDVVLADSLRTPSYEQGSEAVKPACVSRGERGGVLRVWGTEYFYERATNIGDVVDGSIVPDWNA